MNFGGDPDGKVLEVLDIGCNNTCHGDRWMARFHQMYGMMPAAEPADARFKGVEDDPRAHENPRPGVRARHHHFH